MRTVKMSVFISFPWVKDLVRDWHGRNGRHPVPATLSNELNQCKLFEH